MKIGQIIGRNIKLCLDEIDMDVTQYAKAIESTLQIVSEYISGITIMDSKLLYITAISFNKPMEWFFEEEHKEPKYTQKDIRIILEENKRLKETLVKIKELLYGMY